MLLLLLADVLIIGVGFGVGWLLTLFGFVVGLTIAVIRTWSRIRRPAGSAD
jgi:D-alanyl-lipoteichoic acid acyltransferase DltB (MBOAT superfamily)